MEKYEKPNMEVVDVQNEVILQSVNDKFALIPDT